MFVQRSCVSIARSGRSHASRFSPELVAAAVVSVAGASYVYGERPALAAAALPVNVTAVKKEIADIIENDSKARGDGTSIGPTFVRLAWHASGTYSAKDKTGGSSGAHMRFPPEADWGANAGLASARAALEPVKARNPGISYADLWTLAGSTAIEEMGGPTIPWRGGRKDVDAPTTVPDGRLPDADKGCMGKTIGHVRDIFGRMGFNDREMVALIGAHALGRCHTDASGYWGPWTNAETTFSNEYYRLLVEEKWTVKTTHEGKKWTGPLQYEDPSGKLMMLPADIALIYDKKFRAIVEEYAKDEDAFMKDFRDAWLKLIELGTDLSAPEGGSAFMAFFRKIMAAIGL